jgi:hypothetical protein
MNARRIAQDVEAEWGEADLGDERRSERLVVMATRAVAAPGASFPRQCEGVAELEATYRFLSNFRVRPDAVLAPHVKATQRRLAQHESVIVAHDTTELRFHGRREGLSDLSGGGHGFRAHVALAIGAGEAREALGVLHIETLVQRGPSRRRRGAAGDSESQGLRWQRGVERVEALAPRGVRVIHVMDGEADAYALLAFMIERGHDFVVRGSYDRRMAVGKLTESLSGTVFMTARRVPLTRRVRPTDERRRRRHPPRRERTATVDIRVARMQMLRPTSARGPQTLELNFVQVVEPTPPEGEPAVEWRLWTTLPIDRAADALAVVDAYRARWVVEEYFKALKTGCAFEERQLESTHALTNALALFAPVAWLLLRLRAVGRAEPSSAGHLLLSARQLTLLRALLPVKKRPRLPATPTAHDVMLAVAGLGGHIPNNGDPGWQVLGRGLDDLLRAEELATALEMM